VLVRSRIVHEGMMMVLLEVYDGKGLKHDNPGMLIG
jgi:hypothetical protein